MGTVALWFMWMISYFAATVITGWKLFLWSLQRRSRSATLSLQERTVRYPFWRGGSRECQVVWHFCQAPVRRSVPGKVQTCPHHRTICKSLVTGKFCRQIFGMDSTITWNRLVSHLSKLIFKQLDLLFTVKELSTSMAKPALTAVQRLRKLVGYLKSTPEYCVLVDVPIGGQGRWRSSDLQTNTGFLRVWWQRLECQTDSP